MPRKTKSIPLATQHTLACVARRGPGTTPSLRARSQQSMRATRTRTMIAGYHRELMSSRTYLSWLPTIYIYRGLAMRSPSARTIYIYTYLYTSRVIENENVQTRIWRRIPIKMCDSRAIHTCAASHASPAALTKWCWNYIPHIWT